SCGRSAVPGIWLATQPDLCRSRDEFKLGLSDRECPTAAAGHAVRGGVSASVGRTLLSAVFDVDFESRTLTGSEELSLQLTQKVRNLCLSPVDGPNKFA